MCNTSVDPIPSRISPRRNAPSSGERSRPATVRQLTLTTNGPQVMSGVSLGFLQHRRIECRHRKKSVAWFACATSKSISPVACRINDRCRTHVKGKHQPIPEAIGVKELGGERDVVRSDIQHAAGVAFATVDPVAVKVHRSFRPAGAARRPEPERDIVSARGRRLQRERGVLEELVPMEVILTRSPQTMTCLQ